MKMKILVAGDTHGNIRHTEYLIRTAASQGCSRVFVVGDFGYWEHTKAGVQFLDQVDAYSSDWGIPVYFLDGNHDKTSLLLTKYDAPKNLDGDGFIVVRTNVFYARRGLRWTWDGLRFIALGGAYSVDKEMRLDQEERFSSKFPPESLWFPEEEMSDWDMSEILEDREPVDVILAHDKPRGSNPRWHRKDIAETWPNQDRLQRAVQRLDPELYIHGHLHWPYVDQMWHSHDGITRDMHVTTVVGLDCDGHAGPKDKSWTVLDTEKVRLTKRDTPQEEWLRGSESQLHGVG